MAHHHYYLLTSLPGLPDFGGRPPLTATELLDQVDSAGGPRELVAALLLGDDLLQRASVLSGQIDRAEPAVLTDSQLAGDQPLPEFLATAEQDADSPPPSDDAVWESYFRYAAQVACRAGSRFLAAWVAREVALRNALAVARARALELDPAACCVATDLAAEDDFEDLVGEWAAAPDPLAAAQGLDRRRWRWIAEHDEWFSFADDELAVYTARLLLLDRWRRLAGEAADSARPAA